MDNNNNGSTTQGVEEQIYSGVEQFLTDLGYSDGKMPFEEEYEDGSKAVVEKDFRTLSKEDQYNILKELTAQSVDFNNEEKELISDLKSKGLTINDYINSKISESIASTNNSQQDNIDYDSMSDEEIYSMSLLSKDKTLTKEDIKEKYNDAKALNGFDKKIDFLRNEFKDLKRIENENYKKEVIAKNMELVDADRKELTNLMLNTDTIAGWTLTHDERNETLDNILRVDEEGRSLFEAEIFSNPERLLRLAFLDKFADEKFSMMEKYFKGEIAKAYSKGKNDALKGTNIDTTRTNFSTNTKKEVGENKRNKKFGEQ